MRPSIFKCCLVAISLLNITASQAQTRSDCRPPPPMSPNAKPGVNSPTFTKDSRTLVVAGGDAKIRFFDVKSGTVQRTISGHTNAIYIAVFNPDEKLLASSSRDLTARIWDVASGRELHKLTGFRCAVKAVAFSPDGRTIAAAGNDGMLKLWDVNTGKELQSFVHIDSADIDMSVYSIAFDRTGKKIYAANGDGTISEWDLEKRKETRVWKAHDDLVVNLQFNRDYSLLASFGYDTVVKLWDTSDWREVRRMSMARSDASSNVPSSLAFSHDGKSIAASSIGLDQKRTSYTYVQSVVWKVETGDKVWTMEGHKFDVNGLTFTRDSKLLLTGSVDRTIKFWDMKTGRESRTITVLQD